MPSTYTPSLRLTLPAAGENVGTWGPLVNNGITALTDASIAGYVSVAMTDADYTLTTANGTTDEARRMMLNMTGTLTAARNVICPTVSKLYVIKNATTGGFAITLKTSAGTGVSIPNGSSMLLMCNGTDVVDAVTYSSFGAFTNLSYTGTLTGGTGVVNLGSGQFYKSAAGNFGFGTATPLSSAGYTSLTLNNTTGSIISMQVAGAEKARIQAFGSAVALSSTDTSPMTFSVNSTEVARVNQFGSLLVGKTSTTYSERLGVKGTGASTPPTNLSSLNEAIVLVESAMATGAAFGGVGYQDSGKGGAAVVFGRGTAAGYDTKILFYTNPATTLTPGAMQFVGEFDSSGNFGVGVSPAFRLHVNSGTTTSVAKFSSLGTAVVARFADGTAETGYIGSGSDFISGLSRTDFGITANTGGALVMGSNGTERMRVGSLGNLLINTVDNYQADCKLYVKNSTALEYTGYFWNASNTDNAQFVGFGTQADAVTSRGSITYNRPFGVVAYNTSSDYRAKDIFGPVLNSGAIIDALNVYEGRMKGATQVRPMLIAHEAQAVAPYCVTGEKDAVEEDGTPKFQQMDVSTLVPLLIAEIQQLRARVAALEA